MAKPTIAADKVKFLDELLLLYKKEIEAIYAIAVSWVQLKDEAKDRCAEDFDQAIIARETFLEEILLLKDAGFKVDSFEVKLYNIDQALLGNSKLVKEIYGMDVKAFLNIKPPKGLLKSGK